VNTIKSAVGILLTTFGAGQGALFAQAPDPAEVQPGVWRFTFGQPETITPVSTRHYPPAAGAPAALRPVERCPVAVSITNSDRGCLARIPLGRDEMIYGLGLQLQSFQQRGLKKRLRVNADPAMDTGDSHAPVPFYVTTGGYGVLIDTARYATFYLGNKRLRPPSADQPRTGGGRSQQGTNVEAAYRRTGLGRESEVLVEIPEARGVDVYVFAGPSLREAVQRYNLFSGGGAMPPRWGLGFWYRAQSDYTQDDVLKLAAEFRDGGMPLDVIGLEPHWQTHSYSASYVWSERFPDPAAFLAKLSAQHLRLNLWEHAFVHPSSPIYAPLLARSGDYEVWGGLAPDFLQPEARSIFAGFHEKEHVAPGVSGYKLDECDNSDFTGNWSFPEISRFPSGADGEQMHSLFGLRYQDAVQSVFEKRGQRTYGLVRSSGALAAPYPYVLYSDLYDHRQYVRALVNAGFSGLLWTPEVRDSATPAELIRRLECVVFSPLAMIDAWFLRSPPWKQVNRAANDAGQFADGWEQVQAQCRQIVELRMKFVPYLHAAFARYHRDGLPPFRALVMDYPADPPTRTNDDEYLMGDDVLVAPMIVGDGAPRSRSVYLPKGGWYDFWSHEPLAGGQTIPVEVPLEHIPLFIKAGAVLPLAQPALHTDDSASRRLHVEVFGDGSRAATLFEDDGIEPPTLEPVRLEWNAATKTGAVIRATQAPASAYEALDWKQIP
jgi:alpha-D-xyloside xylohydrolase